MNSTRLIGIFLLGVGLAAFVSANYIYNRVNQGRQEIAHGQGQIDAGNQFFSIIPFSEIVTDGFTASAQDEVNQGVATANYYAMIASRLQIGALVALILGTGTVVYSFRRRD